MSVTYGIKVLDDTIPHEGPPKGIVLQDEDKAKKSEQFTLEPGERRSIGVHTNVPLAEANIQGVRGELDGPDLILFTDSGPRIVGRNR